METLVKSEVFDLGASTFLIDVVRGDDGKEFIRLKRTDHSGPHAGSRIIEFDAYVLGRIDAVWKAKPEAVTFSTTDRPTTNPRLKRVSVEDRANIVKVYLKNVGPADIAVRYGCKAEDIEEVLRDAGIVVVNHTTASRGTKHKGAQPKRPVQHNDHFLAATRKDHPNAYAPWSSVDDTILAELHGAGADLHTMMARFGRQRGAIKSRLRKLGLVE